MNKDKITKRLKEEGKYYDIKIILDDININSLPYDSYLCFIDNVSVGFYCIYKKRLLKFNLLFISTAVKQTPAIIIDKDSSIVLPANKFFFQNELDALFNDFYENLYKHDSLRFKKMFNFDELDVLKKFYVYSLNKVLSI